MAGKTPKLVGDCISHEFIEVNEEKSLVDAVRDIMQHGTVVVRSSHNQLCGVVTARMLLQYSWIWQSRFFCLVKSRITSEACSNALSLLRKTTKC